MSVVPRITTCARAGAAASLRKTTAAKASATTQPASAILRKAVLLIFFITVNRSSLDSFAENGSNACFALCVGNCFIRGPGRGAQGPPALDQQQNADHRPENIAALADDRQGYASRFGELKYRGDFSGACLVNAHAQRNEFEHDVNDPIDRFENKSGQERRGQRRADETQGEVNLQHARQMETGFEQKDRKKSRAAAAIESIDAVFQGPPVFYPALRQSAPVQKP